MYRDLFLHRPAARRIRPSRFAAGIALHLAVPAYLIWIAVVLVPAFGVGDSDQLAAALGRASIRFLALYLIVLVIIFLTARALEPAIDQARERRASRDPEVAATQSKRQLRAALELASQMGNADGLLAASQRLRSAPWKHDDQRFQSISADLGRASRAFATAFESGSVEEREAIRRLTAGAFYRLAEAVELVAEEQGRFDHGDARTLARYIELRYPPSDFAGEQAE